MMIDKEELKDILIEAMNDHPHYSLHEGHHAWIQARIDAEESRNEMFAEIRKTAIQWSITGLLGGLFFWLTGHIKIWF